MKKAELEEQNKKLIEALKPFADVFQQYGETDSDFDNDLNLLIDKSDLREASDLLYEILDNPKPTKIKMEPMIMSKEFCELMNIYSEMNAIRNNLRGNKRVEELFEKSREIVDHQNEKFSLMMIRVNLKEMRRLYKEFKKGKNKRKKKANKKEA